MIRIKLKNGVLEINKEIVVTLIFDIFAFAYWFSARNLSPAAMMFPKVLLIGIVLFSILAIRQDIHFCREETKTEDGEEIGYGVTWKLVLFLALTLVMLLCYKPIGFILCTFVYLAASMLILGIRNKWIILLVPIGVDVFVTLVFKMWLAVPLPMGLLSFIRF